MGDSIALSIGWGLILFIASFATVRIYLITLSILIAFSILNYWMRINIKEFVKSYFLISFIIFFMAIVIIFYLTYDLEFYKSLVLLDPPEIEKLSPQEYRVRNYFKFLTFVTMFFLVITFIILPCL
ncbi:hypothetical protein P4X55_001749, partial [Campylobacter jejuni]|nr:hypothetical protein [Campylobacter jejuni]